MRPSRRTVSSYRPLSTGPARAIVSLTSGPARPWLPLAAGFAILLSCPAASDDETGLDWVQRREVVEVAMSPNGGGVAYVLRIPRSGGFTEGEDGWFELHLVEPGGASRPLVTGHVAVSEIDWSPDGRFVSYIAEAAEGRSASLHVVPSAGGASRRIASPTSRVEDYSWSPDATRIAFLTAGSLGIRIVPVDRAADGSNIDLDGAPRIVRWSPAGNELAVLLVPYSMSERQELHFIDLGTGRARLRVNYPERVGSMVWNAEGTRVAVLSFDDTHVPYPDRLKIVSSLGGQVQDLLPDPNASLMNVAWQADSLLYLRMRADRTALREIARMSQQTKTLIPAGELFLKRFSASRDGLSAAFVAETPDDPGEVYVAAHGRRELERLTFSNP